MPFTFVDIEKRKSRVIGLFFALIVLFYFLTAYLALFLTESIYGGGLVLPPLKNTLFILAVAFFAALAHWLISINNLMERLLRALGAEPPEEKDAYHQLFKNIVEEVSIAIGGRPLKAVVIPSAAMNAFALEDFNRQAVIGVTEGLLARLSRPQIEAVTAHEAGHIVGGDCLSASVASALAEVYEVILEKLASLIRGAGARGLFLLALLYVLLRLVSFISLVLRFFISRQREYRADAVGVRLTRNPISLAEALQLISDGWRGEGGLGAKIETIFIVNPALNRFDETNGFFADVFSTHPPVQKRIAVLAAMAHLDEKTLEENIKNFKRVAPIAEAEISVKQKNIPRLWLALIDSQWQGPLPAADLGKLTAFRPDTWVRLQNEEAVKPAYEYEELIRLFKKSQAGQEKKTPLCPHCRAPL
ncbi:MAG: M48 family metalloprotease, partial [Elusimicrobia bacterium]|nr:M48 family metalloprotease [Elusimicrobiota bacterium]